jgi:hypothetical protein
MPYDAHQGSEYLPPIDGCDAWEISMVQVVEANVE